ncbi:MutS protein msh5 [Serendipita sp. 399]|nr:MutS protein msh5 [Serendipita sp. 399]
MSHVKRTAVHWANSNESVEYQELYNGNTVSDGSDDDQESSQEAQICMAMMCNSGSVACSYFDPKTGGLYVMEDTEENNHFDLTSRVLEQVAPDLVLTSSKSDDLFMDFVHEQMESSNGEFRVRPWKEFTVSHGLARFQALPLLAGALSTGEDDPSEENLLKPRNAYDFMARRGKVTAHPSLVQWCAGVRSGNFTIESTKAPLCFSTIGALLDYLIRARAVDGLSRDIEELEQVTKIEFITLKDFMQINKDALISLQVFLSEKHASIYSDAMKDKEGLSIYGILNQTRTPMGSALLRQWLLRPSTFLDIIQQRHEAISCFIEAENLALSEILHKHIGGLRGAPVALKRLRNGRATLQNWKSMVQFWVSAALIRTDLLELHEASRIFASEQLLNDIENSTFIEVAENINAIIDWDESVNLGRITIKPLVDEQLDTWKETLAGLDSLLVCFPLFVYMKADIFQSRVAEKVAEDVPLEQAALYKELSVIYFPQLGWSLWFVDTTEYPSLCAGYLISVPVRQDCSLEEQRDALQEWTFQASLSIVQTPFLITTARNSDSVYFKSAKMHEMDYHVGDLNTYIMDREIEILQSLQSDVLCHSDAIITICEKAAVLDWYVYFAFLDDQIIRESSLLSFASAARQYQWVRPTMCEESIIDIQGGRHPLQELVDEHFVANDTYAVTGSATAYRKDVDTSPNMNPETENGAGLFTGVIKYLLNLGDLCPFVFAATHFHEVLTPSMLPPTAPISFVHMSVMITTREGDVMAGSREGEQEGSHLVRPGEAVTYLFNDLLNRNELNALLDEQMSEREREDLVASEAVCRHFLEWDLFSLVNGGNVGLVRQMLAQVVEGP